MRRGFGAKTGTGAARGDETPVDRVGEAVAGRSGGGGMDGKAEEGRGGGDNDTGTGTGVDGLGEDMIGCD
jgi:hypothetical protein